MSYKKAGKIVEVEWEDAWAGSSWEYGDERPPMINISLGRVIRHTKRGIQIAGSTSKEGLPYGRVEFVPKGMIRKIRELR